MACAGGVRVLDTRWFRCVYCLLSWVWLGTVHQSPSLVRYGLSVKDDMWFGELTEPASCDTPVPQPLSVVNSVKAWNLQVSEGR